MPGYELKTSHWIVCLVKITVPVALLAWTLLLVNGEFRPSIYALPGVVGLLVAAAYWTAGRHGHGIKGV
jgi:hypothetical protein